MTLRTCILLLLLASGACRRASLDPLGAFADASQAPVDANQSAVLPQDAGSGESDAARPLDASHPSAPNDAGDEKNPPSMSTPDAQTPGCGDTSSDPVHCGSCNRACPGAGDPAVHCNAGACAIDDCNVTTLANKLHAVCTKKQLNWSDARKRCQALGMDLVDIADAAERDAIAALDSGNSIWIGLNQRSNPGDWYFVAPHGAENGRLVWRVDPQSFMGAAVGGAYVPWAMPPTSFSNLDCAAIEGSSSSFGTNSYRAHGCTSTYGYACEEP